MSIVLSYGNTCLKTEDVRLLNDGEWLNDKLIGFYFEFLENEWPISKDNPVNIIFVSPGVTQAIKLVQQPEEVSIFLEPLKPKESDIIFFAVNNHESASTAGGTHWSLLLFENKTGIFHHFDSAGKLNERNAKYLMKKCYIHVNAGANRPCQFVAHLDCSQQTNSYDCGVYVILYADMLCHRFRNNTGNLFGRLEVDHAYSKRKDMIVLIKKLAADAKRKC